MQSYCIRHASYRMWGVRGGREYPPLTHIQSNARRFLFLLSAYLLVAEAASFDKKELCRSDTGPIRVFPGRFLKIMLDMALFHKMFRLSWQIFVCVC